MRLDHVVMVVSSLAEATLTFVRGGFTVAPGGRHDAIPTENALIAFADGSYLELLGARDPATRDELRALSAGAGWERHLKGVSAVARRFLPLLAGGDGVADWVLTGESLTRRAAVLRARGLKAAGPLAMGREGAEGERIEWQMLLPESSLHPFWIADRTPRERRVPSDARATTHANGATGISAVRVRATNVPVAALELADALNTVPRSRDRATVLELPGLRVEVVEGEPVGACGVEIAGCGALPDALRSLGVAG